MSELLKDISQFRSIAGKISEVVGELGGWMSVLGIGPRRSSPAGGGVQEAGLKAHLMGAGENDEALFWSAVALAKQNGWIDQNCLKNVSMIFSKLNHEERRHLYHIIGRDEQSVTIEAHSSETATKSPQARSQRRRSGSIDDKKEGEGKEQVKKTTATGNVRGAMTIALLAGMNPDDAVAFLRNSGTLTGIKDDLKHLHEKLCKFLKETEAGKKIRKHMKKTVLWYLEAKTLKEAETKVLAKEQALVNRQAQFWHERDLKNRKPLLIIWTALAIFSIAALIYVFTTHQA